MSVAWPEIAAAKTENRHEIKLSGSSVSERISEHGLDTHLFTIKCLNLLNISDTCLKAVPEEVVNLVNLQSLLLFSNEIEKFSEKIYTLKKLKVLDFSRNRLFSIPEGIDSLSQLTSINLSSNELEEFPQIKGLSCLISLDLSNNKLPTFPDVCYADNAHLSDLKLNNNKISEIPGTINVLPVLKNFDISNNQIKIVPQEVAEIPKLKDINLKGNSLADNRLHKLVDQCRTKQIVDYVRQHCSKAGNADASNAPSKGGKKGKKGQQNKKNDTNEIHEIKDSAVEDLCHKMHVLHFDDEMPNVKLNDDVKGVRPHIVCCVVHGLAFTEESFKKFIQMQTKLHDTICDKRNAATIATHDMAKLPPGDLLYTARAPNKIVIHPLMRNRNYTGQELFCQLQQEAENLRKEKKRNVYSGIHKFLYLLEGKKLYPCLEDSKGNVISFPPMTNSDNTKMSHETKSMIVEVTSAQNQGVCRKVMDAFLLEALNMGVGGCIENEESGEMSKYHKLQIQQMKVVDMEGSVRIVYPSKVDLFYEGDNNLKIIRA